jgi:DNA-binding NtrC family response regulator
MVVDDEKLKRASLAEQLEAAGYEVSSYESPFPALGRLRSEEWDVVITDLRMPGMDGIEFLREIKKLSPDTEVLVMTAYGSAESAVAAMKEGAFDYITKPFGFEELSVRLQRMTAHRAMIREVVGLRRELESRAQMHQLLGASHAMRKVFETIRTVADSSRAVLIQGETGTGKELAADAVRHYSARGGKPYVKLSCAMLSREVVESELFGHEAGAFTGAAKRKRGRFEMADGGTLFLDDIDDIPLDLQVKLLRVLQDGRFERVGGEQTLSVDVRLIAATKKDLRQLVKEGKFREDLFYRIHVVPIHLPPLRERREDILLLAEHFLKGDAKGRGGRPGRFSHEAVGALLRHSWPGNVRELQHTVQHAAMICKGDEVLLEDLPQGIQDEAREVSMVQMKLDGLEKIDFCAVTEQVERQILQWALTRAEGNQGKAAELLGIPRTTFREKLMRLTGHEEASDHVSEA